MADLYGARRLLTRRHIPAAAIFDHDEYLRPLVGQPAIVHDRCRFGARQPRAVEGDLRSDSGALRRRIRHAEPPGGIAGDAGDLSPGEPAPAHPFFQAMRLALVDAAPGAVEDPRVVVLSPGTHSETAFDQAFVASLLGFPLLEGSDLTVRDGRVWMRVLGKLEEVDVILRRVDSTWMDALELRPDSRLGVTGLMECVRQGTVSVLNNLGSGSSRTLLCSRSCPSCANGCSASPCGCRRLRPGGAVTRQR